MIEGNAITDAVGSPASGLHSRHLHRWLGEAKYPGGWHHIKDLTAGDEWWVRVCEKGCKQESFMDPIRATT